MDITLLVAILALIGTVVTGVLTLVGTLRKARIDREPNAADVRTADAASNDLILKLLSRTDEQIERDARTIESQKATIQDLQALIDGRGHDADRAVLESALARTQTELTASVEAQRVAQEEARRLRAAILRLRELAEKGVTFTGRDVIVWANNALDLTVPLEDLLQLPADFDDTIIPTT